MVSKGAVLALVLGPRWLFIWGRYLLMGHLIWGPSLQQATGASWPFPKELRWLLIYGLPLALGAIEF